MPTEDYPKIDPAAPVWYWGKQTLPNTYCIYRDNELRATITTNPTRDRARNEGFMRTITAALNAEEQS